MKQICASLAGLVFLFLLALGCVITHADATCADLLLTYPAPNHLARLSEVERTVLAKRFIANAGARFLAQSHGPLLPHNLPADYAFRPRGLPRPDPVNHELGFFQIINHFRLVSPVSRLEVAKALLPIGRLYTADHDQISIIETNPADRVAVESFFAVARTWPMPERIQFALDFVEYARPAKLVFLENLPLEFGITDPAMVKELRIGSLKTYIKRWGDKKGRRFEDLRPIFEKRAMSANSWDLVSWSLDYEQFSKHVDFQEFWTSLNTFGENEPGALEHFLAPVERQRQILALYGTHYIAGVMDIKDLEDLPLRPAKETPNEPTLPGVLKKYAQKHPGVIPETLLTTLASGTGDQDTYTYLLNAAFRHLSVIEKAGELDFNELLTYVFPWPREQMAKWSKQGRWDILAFAAQIFNTTGKSLFDYLPLDTQDFPAASDLAELMEVLRNNYQLVPAGIRVKKTLRNPQPEAAALKLTVAEFLEKPKIAAVNSTNVRQMIESGRQKFGDKIRAIFSDQSDGLPVTFDDLMKLQTQWSDIEPVLTLFSRLTTPATRLIVKKVLLHSLHGTFDQYKFEDPEAVPQVGFLSPAENEAWRQTRVRVSSAGAEARRATLLEAKRQIELLLNGTIIPALATLNTAGAVPTPLVDVRGLLEQIGHGNPFAITEQFLGTQPDRRLAAAGLLRATEAQMLDPNSRAELRRDLARVLNVLVVKAFAADLGANKAIVSGALKDIERLVPKELSPEIEAKGLVVSVLDHSPRLMMTVGDLVQTKSCQSYSTGRKIYTLPAYVIDANVRVMASFHVEAKHFANRQIYRAVLQGLEDGSIIDTQFMGNQRTLKFVFVDGHTLDSEFLGYAFLRQMVKLGYVDTPEVKRASVRLEKEYSQNSEYLEVMRQQHRALTGELKHDLHAIQNKTMHVVKSRNPEGVYSDLGVRVQEVNGGVHTEAYDFKSIDEKDDQE